MKPLAFLLLSLALSPAFAQISATEVPSSVTGKTTVYRWVDKQGRVSFTDVAPPVLPKATEAKEVSSGTAPTTSITTANPQAVDLSKAPVSTVEISTADEAAKERQRQCQRAKLNQTTLAAGGRVQLIDEQGQKVVLNEAGIQREKKYADQAVLAWCETEKKK